MLQVRNSKETVPMPRPKSFDPETVLTKAMVVFWEKGFDAASISDLTAAMGINRFSLYDTFGDKHALYIKALESYETSILEPILAEINAFQSIEDMKAHSLNKIDYHREHADQPCCMIHKAAISMAAKDQETLDRVNCIRKRINEAFTEVFERLIEKGEIRKGITASQAAWLVMFAHEGMMSHLGAAYPPDQAKKEAITALYDSISA